jgi:hypothetical protein
VAITERRSREDIDRLADSLGRAIAEIGADGAFRTHEVRNAPIAEETSA